VSVELQITLHEGDDLEADWAEWEMWREYHAPPNSNGIMLRQRSEWIGQGTAPSFEAAIDDALNVWRSAQGEAEDSPKPAEGKAI
jgi:hypothetical protein